MAGICGMMGEVHVLVLPHTVFVHVAICLISKIEQRRVCFGIQSQLFLCDQT